MKKMLLTLSSLVLYGMGVAQLTAPTLETFSTNSTPTGWSQSTSVSGSSWEFGQLGSADYGADVAGDRTGDGGYFAWVDFSDNITSVILEMPEVNVAALTTPVVQFYLFSNNIDNSDLNILNVESWDGTNWNRVDSIQEDNGGWTKYSYVLTSHIYNTDKVKIRFRAEDGPGTNHFYNDLLIDDVRIFEQPTCVEPTALNVSNITSSSANLTWTDPVATNWQVEYGTQGFTQGSGTLGIISTNTFGLSSLTPNTDYEFYVRSICTAGDTSIWSSPFGFTTSCNAFAVPFVEGFNTSSTTEDCWKVINRNGDADEWNLDYAFSSFEGGQSASINTNFNSGNNDDYLITPQFTLTGNDRLRFFTRSGSTTDGNDYRILISTTGFAPADFTTTLLVDTIASTSYEEKIIDLDAYTGNVYLAFHIPNGGRDGVRLYIDQVNIEPIPSCPKPNALNVASITDVTAELGWTDNAGAGNWQIEYGASGFTQGAGTLSMVNTNPSTLSTLMPNTAYEFYVRAVCGAGDSSVWVGPMSFSTECATVVPSYTEGFTSFVPDCWEEAGAGDLATGPSSLGSGDWVTSTIFTNRSARINLFDDVDQEWLLSPFFDLSAGPYEVALNVAVTNWNSSAPDQMGSDDSVTLAYTEDGTTWIAINTWTVADALSNSLTNFKFPLASTASNVRFAIWATDGTVDDTEDYDFHVDDFFVGACPAPGSLTANNITDVTAILEWTETGSAASWQVEYGISGFTNGAGTSVLTTVDTALISGLLSNTAYDFYVRAICGPGDTSGWAGPVSFTTECSAFMPSYTERFTSFLPGCWDEAGAGDLTTGPSSLGSGDWISSNSLSTQTARINLWSNNDREWLLSPLFDLSGGGNNISLDVAVTNSGSGVDQMGSDDSVTLAYTEDGTTWNAIKTWTVADALPNALTNFNFPIPSTGTQVRFGIRASDGTVNDSEDYNFHVDNFFVGTCPAPMDLAVTGITEVSAILGWTETGSAGNWQIEYDTMNFALGTGTSIITTNNPFTLSGLTQNTAYEFYVRSICGAGDTSEWSGPLSFTTECSSFTLPWTENFENGGTVPDCWTMSGGEDWSFSDNGSGDHIGNNGTINGATTSGNYFGWVDASGTQAPAVLTGPFVDISTLTSPQLSFFELSHNEGNANSTLDVEVWDGAAWNAVATYNTNTFNGWEKKEINLSGLTFTGLARARFTFSETVSGDFYDDIAIDDVTFEERPSCPKPGFFNASTIAGFEVHLNWLENGSAATWEIEYGAAGFTLGSGTSVITTTNPDTILGLNTTTSYDFYVRAICGAGDSSVWVGPLNLTTTVSCPAPTDLEATSITDVSANLGWTEVGVAGNWEIEYGLDGFARGAGTTVSTTNNPYALSGLTPNTDYDFYLRSVCGAGDSSAWVGPFSFETACSVFTPFYAENFQTFLPSCWSEGDDGDLTTGPSLGNGTWISNSALSSPTARVNLYTTTRREWLLSPLFDLSAGGYEVSLSVAVTDFTTGTDVMGSDDSVTLAYTENGTTWIALKSWTAADALPNTLMADTFTVSSTGTSVQFGILASDGTIDDTEDYYFHVDDFAITQVAVPVSCPAPSALSQVSKTSTSIELGWTENGSATDWEIEWGTNGFVQGTGTSQIVTNPFTVTSLSPLTMYDFYVRSICGTGDSSTVVGPLTIRTDSIIDGIASNLENLVNIYPNPSEGLINVEFSSFQNGNSIELISVRGEILQTVFINANIMVLDARDLPKGLYTLRIMNGNEVGYRKVMIK